jgi:oligopeptide transport system substrate-binding protein
MRSIARVCALFLAIGLVGCSAPAPPATQSGASSSAAATPAAAAPTTGAKPAAPATGGGQRKVLRIMQPSQTDTLDPAMVINPWSIQPVEDLFEPLTTLDANNIIQPSVAKSWAVSQDGLTWTFNLRNDVKFSNGDPVTARDFVYELNRQAWPETKSSYVFELEVIQGTKEVESGATREISGVKAPDDYTLQFTLTEPAAYFLAMTATFTFAPVSQKAVEQFGDQWATPGNIVSNGAFLLKSWDRGTQIVMDANPNFFAGKPQIDGLEINFVPDPQTALLKYENGELDVVDIPDADFQRISQDATLSKQMHRSPLLQARWIAFNVSKPPFDNQALREAIAYSVDRQKLSDLAFSGTVEAACTEAPPNMIWGGNPPFCWPTPDAAKAKQKLAEAGYPNGQGLPSVQFGVRNIPSNVRAVENVTSQIKAALGWDIGVNPMTPQAMNALRKNGNPDKQIIVGTWGLDYNDPQEWFGPLYGTKQAFNYSDISDPDIDGLLKKAQGLNDQQQRYQIYTDIEQIMLNKMYVVPLWQEAANYLVKPNVHNFAYSVAYLPSLKNVAMD